MISAGINGFGRIGKAIFIQLLENPRIQVTAINALDFDIKYMETYLKHDSVHKYNIQSQIKIIDKDNFQIGENVIHIFRNKNASELDWRSYGINHVIEATGAYLTTQKCQQHPVDYVIMSAPPKDNTPMFVFNVNDYKYKGEKVISNASCTTNCITPVLKFLNDNYKINNANFTTIHATTASQTTVDTINSNNRTHRSILNNIIPHSTGASQAIYDVIPSLAGKVYGTSLRVPVSNVSIVDLNVELEESTTIDEIMTELETHPFIKLNTLNLVSGDFLTTTYPSIVDRPASMHLGGNRFKIMIWYDNEWSYSAQVIRMLEKVIEFEHQQKQRLSRSHKCFIDNFHFHNENVVLRVDWNVPTRDFKMTDDYRIASSMPTIRKILQDGASRLVIMSHFGRPEGHTDKYSWRHYLDKIQTYFGEPVCFLEHGLTQATLDILEQQTHRVYLLENLRFHDEETNYTKYPEDNEARQVIQKLGDFYVNDAFGCMHRDHLSICGIHSNKRAFGYLVNSELEALKILMDNNENKKILAICGGAKVHDKLPLLDALSKKMDHIYIAGGNINGIIKDNNMEDYIHQISKNKAQIHLMVDGYCATSIGNDVNKVYHYTSNSLPADKFFYDVGTQSLRDLAKLVAECDVIFWNGTLGVVENALYREGSNALVKLLMDSGKQVIIGGGDTAGFVNNYPHQFDFVSTGGGACIDYISNGSLIGVDFFK
jgi:glyceraldehyde 3-phosphate dehydrogenase